MLMVSMVKHFSILLVLARPLALSTMMFQMMITQKASQASTEDENDPMFHDMHRELQAMEEEGDELDRDEDDEEDTHLPITSSNVATSVLTPHAVADR